MHPDPVFLGVADRLTPNTDVTGGACIDVTRLRATLPSHIFPLDLRNVDLVFALPAAPLWTGELLLSLPGGQEIRVTVDARQGQMTTRSEPHWLICGVPLRSITPSPCAGMPGGLVARTETDSGLRTLGTVDICYVPAPELTHEQRLAVTSNPLLNRAVRVELGCTSCSSRLTPYCALTRDVKMDDAHNPVWYRDLDDEFRCACGKTRTPLRFLRESMHCLLVQDSLFLPDQSISFRSEVSLHHLNGVLAEFERLLDSEPHEEKVQVFMQDHPLLLAPFAANHLFFKPKILTKFTADFGVVDARGELLLIEIERTCSPLDVVSMMA